MLRMSSGLRLPSFRVRSTSPAPARARSRRYQRMIAAVDDDLGRLRRLVDTLFRLTRADQDGIPISFNQFDLAETMTTIAEQYSSVAQAAGIELNLEVTPMSVVLDEDLIVQVLVNLVDNALAHTPVGGTVALGCRRAGADAVMGPGHGCRHRCRPSAPYL